MKLDPFVMLIVVTMMIVSSTKSANGIVVCIVE